MEARATLLLLLTLSGATKGGCPPNLYSGVGTPHRTIPWRLPVAMGLLLIALVSMLAPAQPSSPTTTPTTQGPMVPGVAARQATNVAIITIHGEIDESSDGNSVMATSVQRRLDLAVRSGADAIVFDIDTPGGGVRAVLRISSMIKQCPVRNTVAWINTQAISGGAIIALACREIIVNDPVIFGDAMPVAADPIRGVSPIDNEQILKKLLPPLVADVRDSARRFNNSFGAYVRDEYLMQALIANDVELWFVRHKDTGVRMCIDRAEFELLFPGQTTTGPVRLAGAPGTSGPRGPTVEGAPAGSSKLAIIADVLAADQGQLASSRPVLSSADAGRWEVLAKATDGTGAAVLGGEDMIFFGLAVNAVAPDGSVVPIRTDKDVADFFQSTYLKRLDQNWSEGLVLFLTSFWVRGLILAVFLIGLFVEMTHPGVSLPGFIALIALAAFIAPPMLIGMASWWEVAAILAGIALIGIEIFVTPGFGVPGILGLILLFGGLVTTFIPQGGLFPTTQEAQSNLLQGMVTVVLAMVTAGAGFYVIARHMRSIPFFRGMILVDAGEEPVEPMLRAMAGDEDIGVGDEGECVTPMRPAGRVIIDGRVVDAVAEFGYIPENSRVRVVSATPFRIGVELISPPPASGPDTHG